MNIVPHYEDAILEVTVDGEFTDEEITRLEAHFKEMKAGHSQVKMLLVIDNIHVTLKGLIEDLKFDMKYWNDFDKIAVVSDKKSVEIVTRLSSVLPKLEMKHFTLSKVTDATSWLKE
ncbi:SpoIIAA family protein [Salisediminibacterium selenitireducens]|uniref:UspA domain protein n=1 Tax=Bacillus selenitireducens (strain ATCC 700615 / DSM 15326 / MLS10) TaxID=439292 RepID=D6XVY9_BACIE|nr:STAS/SEC14 domain-containing protein [Salisediminibacterium selenitireducens]ADH97762.1 hypothetical protein Bsel_0216 [[Bacillus] selenitireducens MLS10]